METITTNININQLVDKIIIKMASQQRPYPPVPYIGHLPPQQLPPYQQIQTNHNNHNFSPHYTQHPNCNNNNMISHIPTLPPTAAPPPSTYSLQPIPQSISHNVARPARGHGLTQCRPQYQPFQPLPPSLYPPSPIIEPKTNTNDFADYMHKNERFEPLESDKNSEFMIPLNNNHIDNFAGYHNNDDNTNHSVNMPMPFDPNQSFFGGLDNMSDCGVMDGMYNDNNFNRNDNKLINNHKCPHCARTFQHKSNLTIHLKIHSPSAFVCGFCGKKFARHSNLRQHTRVHTNERPFKCKHCPKSFKQQHSLADHVRIHTGEKPHKCEFCSKGFAARCNLIVHRRIHTGERPYKCDVCHKQYASKSGYNSHQKKYHPYQIDARPPFL